MTLTEDKLSAEIRAGRLGRFYFLYGKETFLVKTYADRLIKKAVGAEPFDLDLVRLEGISDAAAFSEYAEGLPVFSELKAVVVHNPDIEGMLKDTLDGVTAVISDIPDTTIIIFYTTNVEYDAKKLPAKLSKFVKDNDKYGTFCFLDTLQPSKLAELAIKKAAKQGVILERREAEHLTDRVGGSMTQLSDEMSKLISYCGSGGTITLDMIDKLVPRQLDAEVYDLAAAINAGRKNDAFRVIDELYESRYRPEQIMSALSGTFIDYYRCRLAKSAGMGPQQAGEVFGYGKRAWVLSKVFPYVGKLETSYLRETIRILSDADTKIKSTGGDGRTVIEQAVTTLFMCRERRV